ncbi:MAG: hypothetical protein OSA11_10295 [Candidatus Nanopelagicales bacterium]|nr:hypothetical protein [Candidatus Nanopelagicales bacterium]
MKKAVVSFVAVLGLILTTITGCSSGDDFVSTEKITAKKNEATLLSEDCEIIQKESLNTVRYMENSGLDDPRITTKGPGYFIELKKMAARIWPRMNDSNLESIFRGFVDGWDGESVTDDPNWIAYEIICRAN